MKMERRTIGAFLAVLRKANGLTQQQVADRLNVSNKTVSKWERDESLPDITLIPALAEMFHVTSDEILRGQRMEPAERTEKEQEKQAGKTRAQARALIVRTMNRHLSGTTCAAAMLAAGMIALFTVSYAFYNPVLGFGVFMILTMAALMMEFLSTNTARTALTGGEMLSEDDALSAEKEILRRAKGLVSWTAVLLIWALPLVLIRSDFYVNSVISFSAYLALIPVLAVLSALVYMLAELVCRKIWPELQGEHENTEKKLRRLYAAAGCALALILMAAFAGLINAGSQVTVEARQTIRVQFDDQAAYREYIELAEDCALGGSEWMEYCEENLAERGIPWKGEITDVEKDYLIEYGYLPGLNEQEDVLEKGYYHWAFSPDMQSIEGMEVCFEMEHYRSGDSEAQLGILALAAMALAVLGAIVFLRRKYILKEAREKRLHEQGMREEADEEPQEAETDEE